MQMIDSRALVFQLIDDSRTCFSNVRDGLVHQFASYQSERVIFEQKLYALITRHCEKVGDKELLAILGMFDTPSGLMKDTYDSMYLHAGFEVKSIFHNCVKRYKMEIEEDRGIELPVNNILWNRVSDDECECVLPPLMVEPEQCTELIEFSQMLKYMIKFIYD